MEIVVIIFDVIVLTLACYCAVGNGIAYSVYYFRRVSTHLRQLYPSEYITPSNFLNKLCNCGRQKTHWCIICCYIVRILFVALSPISFAIYVSFFILGNSFSIALFLSLVITKLLPCSLYVLIYVPFFAVQEIRMKEIIKKSK